MTDLPKTPKLSTKRKRELLIIGAAGVILLFLYMRSRSASSGSSTNATNAADTQAAIDNAVAQQQAQDAATYGYGAYGGSGSYGGGGSAPVDLSPVTSGLSQLDTDLQNLPTQIAGEMPYYTSGPNPPASAAPPPATSPAAQAPVTVQIIGQPAATKPAGVRLSTHVPKGDIAAPFGAKKPAAPKGYVAIGTGSGNWAFKPAAPKTGTSSHKQAKTKSKK